MPRLSNDWLLNPVITGVFTEKLSETRNEPRWHVFTVFELKQKLLLGSVLCFLEVVRALSSKAWAKTLLALNKAKIQPSRAWSLAQASGKSLKRLFMETAGCYFWWGSGSIFKAQALIVLARSASRLFSSHIQGPSRGSVICSCLLFKPWLHKKLIFNQMLLQPSFFYQLIKKPDTFEQRVDVLIRGGIGAVGSFSSVPPFVTSKLHL